MAKSWTQEEVAFRNATHKALLGQGVFPEGHDWAGLTKAESLLAAKRGMTAAEFLAAKNPAPATEEPKPAAPAKKKE